LPKIGEAELPTEETIREYYRLGGDSIYAKLTFSTANFSHATCRGIFPPSKDDRAVNSEGKRIPRILA